MPNEIPQCPPLGASYGTERLYQLCYRELMISPSLEVSTETNVSRGFLESPYLSTLCTSPSCQMTSDTIVFGAILQEYLIGNSSKIFGKHPENTEHRIQLSRHNSKRSNTIININQTMAKATLYSNYMIR